MGLFPNFDRFKKTAKEIADAAKKLAEESRRGGSTSPRKPGATGFWSSVIKKMGPWGPLVDSLFRGQGKSIEAATARELDKAIRQLEQAGYEVTKPAPVGKPKPIVRELVEEDEAPDSRKYLEERRERRGYKPKEREEPEEETVEQPQAVDLFEGMIPVTSSNVHSIGFLWDNENSRAGTLFVRFLGGDSKHRAGPGAMYKYLDVPRAVFVALKMASSVGSAVWDELRVRGTVSGHQFAYELANLGNLTSVPRQAVVGKRGRGGEAFVKRRFGSRESSLPERQVRSGRALSKDFRGEASRIRLERGKRRG